MTRREILFTIGFAVAVLLSVYQCGTAANDRAAKDAARDSLQVSRDDRAALRSQLATTELLRDLAESQNAGLLRRVAVAEDRASRSAHRADSLTDRVDSAVAALSDTATMVPRRILDIARSSIEDWRVAYGELERANAMRRDSIQRNDSIIKAELFAVRDSVKAFLAREEARAPTITAGVNAGSDRCGWGPWDVMPCLTRKQSFVVGAIAGAVGVTYGNDIVRLVKRQF